MPPPSQSEPATPRTMVYANMAAVFSGVSLAFVAARLS